MSKNSCGQGKLLLFLSSFLREGYVWEGAGMEITASVRHKRLPVGPQDDRTY